MRIKINEANSEKLEAGIAQVMGKAKSFVHTSKDLIALVDEAETDLSNFGLAKSNRAGACLIARMQGPSKSYQFNAVASTVVFQRGASDWFLVNVIHDEICPAQTRKYRLDLSEKHVRSAASAWKRSYGIQVNWNMDEGQAITA